MCLVELQRLDSMPLWSLRFLTSVYGVCRSPQRDQRRDKESALLILKMKPNLTFLKLLNLLVHFLSLNGNFPLNVDVGPCCVCVNLNKSQLPASA